LPVRVSCGKFIQYLVDYSYFSLNDNQRDYILFTEAQYNYCTKSSIVICPANTVIYHNPPLSCEASLFFQKTDTFGLCQRKLLLRHQTPILKRHGALRAYFFPEWPTITLRCPNSGNQPPHTMSLQGAGLVQNISTCYLSSSTLLTLPELTGSLHAKLETSNLYLPGNISPLSDYETHQLKDTLPADTSRIVDTTSQLAKRKQTFDVEILFHVHETSQQQEQRTRWFIVLSTSICIAFILGIFCFTLYPHCHNLRCYALLNVSNSEPYPQNSSSSTERNQRDTTE
jgi:hypothetical protein